MSWNSSDRTLSNGNTVLERLSSNSVSQGSVLANLLILFVITIYLTLTKEKLLYVITGRYPCTLHVLTLSRPAALLGLIHEVN